MTPTNRPITSREYKLLLNTERFRDRRAGAELFWQVLEFLAANQGNGVISADLDPEKNVEKRRTTWYLDTPGYELQRSDITLRVREETDPKKPYKVTLKYRAPDRYTAAGCDLRCTEEVKDDDLKFEEDIVPPFVSKFSYSASFKTGQLPQLETMKDAAALFPGLADYDILPATPLAVVNGFRAHEVLHYIGKLRLDRMPTARALKLPDFVVKAALSHWYLRPDENDYPLVTEFSFSCDANKQGKGDDQLEKFPPTVVAGANRLFRDVLNQAGWLAQFGSTKTAYAFAVL